MNFNIPIFKSVIPSNPQQVQNMNIEDNNPIENSLTKQFSEDLRKNHENLLREFEHISKDLIKMGYHPRIVTNSFLAFKYKNIEEAIELIDKTEFSLWNHKFIASDNNLCYVCEENEENHKTIDNVLRKKNTDRINQENSLNIDIKDVIKKKSSNLNLFAQENNFDNDKNVFNRVKTDNKDSNFNGNDNPLGDKILDEMYNVKPGINKDDSETCPICFFKLDEGKTFNLECNHKFCKECIDEYLKEEIKNSRVENIKCPQKECGEIFKEKNVEEIVSEEFFYKYKKFLLREKYKHNPNYIICPIINCEGYAEKDKDLDMIKKKEINLIIENDTDFIKRTEKYDKIEVQNKENILDNEHNIILDYDNMVKPNDENKAKSELKNEQAEPLLKKKKLICNNKHEFCSNCNQAWHGDSNCEEDKEIKDFATYSGIIPKKCPNCKVWTEKNLGCNHMKCKLCSYNWCWLCSNECKEDHYINPGPCQGKQFDEGQMELRQENLFIARLLYNYNNNPLVYFFIFPIIIFFTFNNMINTLLSPQRNRNRQVNPNAINLNAGLGNEVNNENDNDNNLNNQLNGNRPREVIENQPNMNNINNINGTNLNRNLVNNGGGNLNTENNNNIFNDLEMNIPNVNNNPDNNNLRNEYTELGCCQKIFTKILLIFMISVMTLIFTIMFATFNMFNLFPITMLLGRFDNNINGGVKCIALGTYMIYFFISYPIGAGLSIAYFSLLYLYCFIKTIIS